MANAWFPASVDKVIGMEVFNPQGVSLGLIDNIIFDLPSGKVILASLAIPELEDVEGRSVVVPWQLLSFDEAEGIFLLSSSHERLLRAPHPTEDFIAHIDEPTYHDILAYYHLSF